MKLAVDSSSLAKRYVEEYGSDEFDGLLQGASELALCIILVPEVLSGLNRRVRDGGLTRKDYGAVKRRLLADVADAIVLQITPEVIAQSLKLLEAGGLRAMDALHLACACEWKADLFVTSDKRQFRAAQKAKITARYLGTT